MKIFTELKFKIQDGFLDHANKADKPRNGTLGPNSVVFIALEVGNG